MKKRIWAGVAMLLLACVCVWSADGAAKKINQEKKNTMVTLKTNFGDIRIELFEAEAPITMTI